MEKWKFTALILCGFGLFKEFRPSEPYLVDYLVDYKGIPLESIVQVAFPVATYSYLATLVLVFLLTDFLRYRIVIIASGTAFVAAWIILIWTEGIKWFLVVEVLFGVTQSTEVAYFTYIYAQVDKIHYQKVTSYTYSAVQLGRFVSATASQLLVTLDLMNYHELNYITLGCLSIALIISISLESVPNSIYFHRTVPIFDTEKQTPTSSITSSTTKVEHVPIAEVFAILWTHFKIAYTNSYVLRWSICWSFSFAGFLHVWNYSQTIWYVIESEGGGDAKYNAAVEAISCAFTAILAFSIGLLKVNWESISGLFKTISSFSMGAIVLWMSSSKTIFEAYGAYLIFRMLFQLILTIGSAEVSIRIQEDSHGLIFGVNTFVAIALQSLLTFLIADQHGFALSERDQYFVVSIVYFVIGGFFLLLAIIPSIRRFCKK